MPKRKMKYGPARELCEGFVIQRIERDWYVFPSNKKDERGIYFGAVVAGAPSRDAAIRRFNK